MGHSDNDNDDLTYINIVLWQLTVMWVRALCQAQSLVMLGRQHGRKGPLKYTIVQLTISPFSQSHFESLTCKFVSLLWYLVWLKIWMMQVSFFFVLFINISGPCLLKWRERLDFVVAFFFLLLAIDWYDTNNNRNGNKATETNFFFF